MTNLNRTLRALADGEAPAPGDLADRALARAHTRSRHRQALGVVGAALAVVLVAGAILTSLHGATKSSAPAPAATTTGGVLARPRVNVLVIGSDAGDDRVGVRPDTIVVASIDTRSGDAALIGLPRNLERVPFPPGTPQARAFPHGYVCAQHACLLNALWQWGETEGRRFYPGSPRPGLVATREAAEQITGLRMDETVVVNLKGLVGLVDAVGGVDVTVTQRLPIGGNAGNPHATEWIEAGRQHLDGHHALWYARSRWSTDDADRMERQQRLLTALIQQVDGAELARAYPRLAATLQDDVQTSIRAADLPDWARLAARMSHGHVSTGTLVAPGRTAHPDYAKARTLTRWLVGGHT